MTKVALIYVDSQNDSHDSWFDIMTQIGDAITAKSDDEISIIRNPEGTVIYGPDEQCTKFQPSPIEVEIYRLIEMFNNG